MRQLMLMDTPYEDVLHGDYPKCEDDLVMFLDGLDFTIEEWLGLLQKNVTNQIESQNHDKVASDVLMSVMWCRYVMIDFWLPTEERTVEYIDVMKAIKELKQQFMKLAKRYSREPYLANWYLDLPLRVQASFKHIHMKKMSYGLDTIGGRRLTK
jgi:hypothetical protein